MFLLCTSFRLFGVLLSQDGEERLTFPCFEITHRKHAKHGEVAHFPHPLCVMTFTMGSWYSLVSDLKRALTHHSPVTMKREAREFAGQLNRRIWFHEAAHRSQSYKKDNNGKCAS